RELLGFHTVTLPVIFSLVVFILGSLLIKQPVYTFPSANSVNQPANLIIQNWINDHTIRYNIRSKLLFVNKINTEIKINVNRKTLPRIMINRQNMKPKQHQKINFQTEKTKKTNKNETIKISIINFIKRELLGFSMRTFP